ncbi:MAG TPA: DinB family protein [Actinomycetota bacterium]|nr:DinB family protein [Actinomycetota bacterium]
MLVSIEAFLGWFEGIHRRTLRDVSLLPTEAETWTPPPNPEEEASWGIPKLVSHTAESRGYFASAFAGRGWVWDPWPDELSTRETWPVALEQSLTVLQDALRGVGDERLREKIELIDGDRKVSAWRTLMMMAEHEVHHRAQISAYAGLNGWPVAQTFDRTNEWVVEQRERQIERFRSQGR